MAAQMCFVASHGVPDQEKWYQAFREHDGFHKELGITHSHASMFEKDGKKQVQVIHMFPKDKEEAMRKAMDFTTGPFPELIKSGIIIEPITSQFSDVHSIAAPQEHGKAEGEKKQVVHQDGEVCFIASHGVPDFDGWYKVYLEQDNGGFHTNLGITGSMVSKTEVEGKPRIQVVHFMPKDKLEGAQKVFDFKGPPFVGGPDLIKNGVVIEPITSEFSTLKM